MSQDDQHIWHILCVDDVKTMTTFVGKILAKEGYRVSEVQSAGEALAYVRDEQVDLILSDVMMPGMDGFQLCTAIKANENTAVIPVILLTSRAQVGDMVKGLDAGAEDYITKPFRPELLKARIRTALRLKGLQDELRTQRDELATVREVLEEKVQALEKANRTMSGLQRSSQKALEIAARVQLELIPKKLPEPAGYVFSARFVPAESVGGDFYDFIPLEGGRIGIAIGDVSGKGAGAALVMVLARTLLATEAVHSRSPAELLLTVNRLMLEQYGGGDAVTLFYGILDPEEGSFHFSNAGHEFPILYSRRGAQIRELAVGGPFLGLFPDPPLNEGKIYLDRQDRLVLFTDGVLSYCFEKIPGRHPSALYEFLAAHADDDGEALLHNLYARAGRGGMADDLTTIVIDTQRARTCDRLGWVRLQNDPLSLKELRPFTQGVAAYAGLSRAEAFDFVYAVDEAVINGIVHAYPAEERAWVEVTVGLAPGTLIAEVNDRGTGFDWPKFQALIESEAVDPQSPQGRGLRMIRGLVDKLEVTSAPGKGTQVRISKNLPPRWA